MSTVQEAKSLVQALLDEPLLCEDREAETQALRRLTLVRFLWWDK